MTPGAGRQEAPAIRTAQFGVEVDQSRATYLRMLGGVVTIGTPTLKPRVVPPGDCAGRGLEEGTMA